MTRSIALDGLQVSRTGIVPNGRFAPQAAVQRAGCAAVAGPSAPSGYGTSRGKGLMERNRRRYAIFNVIPFALTFAITAASELPVSRSDAFAIHRVQSLLPAWLVVLLIVPGRRPHMTP